jgi:hypothetical protein
MRQTTTAKVRLDAGKAARSSAPYSIAGSTASRAHGARLLLPTTPKRAILAAQPESGNIELNNLAECAAMRSRSTSSETERQPELSIAAIGSDLPIAPGDLEKLARWIPNKEMTLLLEICDRARRDPDLTRPALLLCSAYAKQVARMLDQDPFPVVTQKMADRLQELRERSGL